MTTDCKPPRCVCGHVVHGNIGGSGACRTAGCPCPQFHDKPIPDKCECRACWLESNMPPEGWGLLYDPL